MLQYRLRALALALILALTAGIFVGSPASADPGTQNTKIVVDWRYGPSGTSSGFWNVDQVMWVHQKAPSTYWAMAWNWQDELRSFTTGYMGLQTDGNRWDGTRGDTAIFSLWGANAAVGHCGRFAPENGESGYSCRVPMTIYNNVMYRYRLWIQGSDSGGQWWGAWILNGSTGAETYLGRIRVASSHRRVRPPMNFTEYYGPQVACNRVPVSVVNWTQPAANHQTSGYEYYSKYAGYRKEGCIGGSATATNYGWTSGAFVYAGG